MATIDTELLSQAVRDEIDSWLAKFPADQRQSALLPALTVTQEANGGWLSDELITAVAEYLQIPVIAAFEAATFYSMYDLEPVGKHKIYVCTNISCKLRGSGKIVNYLEKCLDVKVGQTTKDGKFSLREAECLAACVNAPMMQVDKDYHLDLDEEKVKQILTEYE